MKSNFGPSFKFPNFEHFCTVFSKAVMPGELKSGGHGYRRIVYGVLINQTAGAYSILIVFCPFLDTGIDWT